MAAIGTTVRVKAGFLAIGYILPLPTVAQDEIRLLEFQTIPAIVRKAPGYDPGMRLCSLHLYSNDADAKGTNIRAAPSVNAPIIGTLPGKRAEADTKIGPEFQVLGAKGGWLLIRNAHWAAYVHEEELLFPGPGWIAAKFVGFEIEHGWLYDTPQGHGQRILKLSSLDQADSESHWGPEDVRVERVYGCSGSFLEVDIETPNGQKKRGWVTGVCGNQVTTCGGGDAFVEERKGKLVVIDARENSN